MTLTPSKMISLGTRANPFTLTDTVSGNEFSLEDLSSEVATVFMFICNHCPYVRHLNQGLVDLANEYIPKGISFIAISANDAQTFPQDGPEKMKEHAEKMEYPFPYLYDETQGVARAYGATCTPDFFICNKNLELVYRGQFDDSRPENELPVTGDDFRAALNSLLAGESVSPDQTYSIGCNIKWKDV